MVANTSEIAEKGPSALRVPAHQVPWLASPAVLVDLDNYQRPSEDMSESDAAWIYRYLTQKGHSPATVKNVQGDMLRLVYFMIKRGIVQLADVASDDAFDFKAWLLSTKDPIDVAKVVPPRFVDNALNPNWRPFRSEKPLAASSVKTCIAQISAVYAFMQDAPECSVTTNPFRVLIKESTGKKAVDEDLEEEPYRKALSLNAYNGLLAYIDSDEFQGSERSRAAKRWMITLFYSTAVRAETFVNLKDSNLLPTHGNGTGWALKFRAKANSKVVQVWTPEQMAALTRYRRAMGLSWPPSEGESPLMWVGIGRGGRDDGPVLENGLRVMMKTLGRQAAHWIQYHGYKQRSFDASQITDEDVLRLENLHPHVLRHSKATHLVNDKSGDAVDRLLAARDHLGHGSVTTTETYIMTS